MPGHLTSAGPSTSRTINASQSSLGLRLIPGRRVIPGPWCRATFSLPLYFMFYMFSRYLFFVMLSRGERERERRSISISDHFPLFPVLAFSLRSRERKRERERLAMATKSEKFSVDFVMGGMAALVSKSAAAPIERLKLLLQNQGEMIKRGQIKRPYKGVGDCFTRVFREEGVLSFWRGNQANVIRYFPTQAFNFAFRGYFKSIFGCSKEKDGYIMCFAGNVASGSAAGATTSLFLYHLDHARMRLGTDGRGSAVNGQHQFRGILDVYSKTLSSDGSGALSRFWGFNYWNYDVLRNVLWDS